MAGGERIYPLIDANPKQNPGQVDAKKEQGERVMGFEFVGVTLCGRPFFHNKEQGFSMSEHERRVGLALGTTASCINK
jgi:hypothetical protein